MPKMPPSLLAALLAVVAGAPAAWAQTTPPGYPYSGQYAGGAGALPNNTGAYANYGYGGYPGYNSTGQYSTSSSLNNYQQYNYYGQASYGQPGTSQYTYGPASYGQLG